jgi:predicted RNA-binding protein with PUA-like domain
MNYWLMKSEPDTFSIDDLAARGKEPWDGVRNYQARNFMRDGMRRGDKVFIYHSSCAEPGVAGVGKVASAAYPDPGQFDPRSKYFDAGSRRDDPRWWLVDIAYVRKLKRVVTLEELKRQPALTDMRLLQRGNRLSVMPVEKPEWDAILDLE